MKIKSVSKQALAVLLSLSVLASTLMLNTFSVFATGGDTTTGVSVWNGETVSAPQLENPNNENNSADNPYLITNGAELAYLTTTCNYDNTNGKYYKLTKNIHLNDVADSKWYTSNSALNEWKFQNSQDNYFAGTLDGNGCTIYGLYINGPYDTAAGLFGSIGAKAVVKNLRISKAYIYNTDDNNYRNVGAIAGFRNGWSEGDGVVFSNCSVEDDVQLIVPSGCAGAFVGYNNCTGGNTTIENCYSGAKISVPTAWDTNSFACQFVGGRKNKATDKVIIKTSYTTGDRALAISDGTVQATFTNCYTTNADSTEENVTKLTKAQMKGGNALKNMNFDFKTVWYTEAGKTPQLRFGEDENKKPNATELWQAWNGETPTSVEFDGGDGSETKPYLISTPEQLAYLVSKAGWDTNGKYYKLTADIYLNDLSKNNWKEGANPWVGKSNDRQLFWGNIDGQYHTIYGLYFSDVTEWHCGLVPCLVGGTIKNIRISDAYVEVGNDTGYCDGSRGVLVGLAWNGSTIENCVIDDTVELVISSKGAAVSPLLGAITGTASPVNVKNCYVAAKTTGNSAAAFLGGAFGEDGISYNGTNSHLKVTNSYYAGGTNNLVAENDGKPVIFENCYTTSTNVSGIRSDVDGVTKLTKAEMTGMVAHYTMSDLFTVTDSPWIAVKDMTPQLKAFGYSASTATIWDGSESFFAEGDGTSNNPYKISTPEELACLASLTTTPEGSAQTNGKYYRLANDIKLNDINSDAWHKLMEDPAAATEEDLAKLNNWTYGEHTSPSDSIGFGGTLLGNNHKIFGLYSVAENRTALFKGLIGNGTIENLGIENSYIESKTDGGIAAALVGYVIGQGTPSVNSCYTSNSVIVKAKEDDPYTEGNQGGTASGLIGYMEKNDRQKYTGDFSIKNSYSAAQLTGQSKLALIGFWYFGVYLKAENCYGCQADTRLVGDPAGAEKVNYLSTVDKAIKNCYAGRLTQYTYTDESGNAIYPYVKGITKLTSDQMTGTNAVVNMPELFKADDEGNVKWYVMTGETPKLLSFTGKTKIQTGDLNLDNNVDILDLVKLAQVGAGVDGAVINESNKLIVGDFAGKSTAALKRKLLGEAWTAITFNYRPVDSAKNLTGYSYVWGDEFNDGLLNGKLWCLEATYDEANDKQQHLTEFGNTIKMNSSGELVLTSLYDATEKTYQIPTDLSTRSTMNYQYGYLEMRAKLPLNNSAWSAFWTQSVVENSGTLLDKLAGSEPKFMTEIDIFETINSSEPNKLVANVHKWYTNDVVDQYIKDNWVTVFDNVKSDNGPNLDKSAIESITKRNLYDDLTDKQKKVYRDIYNHEQLLDVNRKPSEINSGEYHIIGFEWTEADYKFYIDGVLMHTINIEKDLVGNNFGARSAYCSNKISSSLQDFNQPMYFRIGNGVHEDANETGANFPLVMNVDWVRLYQKNETGLIKTR